MKSVNTCANAVWDQVSAYAKHAVVYIADPYAEILHWHGGLVKLLNAGAVDVQQLSSFESADESKKKALFIVGSLLDGVTQKSIQDVVESSSFQYVVVVTSISSTAHWVTKSGSYEGDEKVVFEMFEDKLLHWMRNMNYTAEVVHLPITITTIGSGVFVSPAFTQLFPLLNSDIKNVELQFNAGKQSKSERKVFNELSEIELNHLPRNTQNIYKMFVSSINDLLDDLGVRDDCYSIGHTSRMLAAELENYPPSKVRRKNCQKRASLIFIDRTLDLTAVSSSQTDTLLHRLTSVLPRLPGHHNDVQVDMVDICYASNGDSCDVLVPGSLSTAESELLDNISSTKIKDSLMEVNRQLVDAASSEKLPVKLAGKLGKVTSEQINTTLSAFKGKYDAIGRHLGIIQVAMAASQALGHKNNNHLDKLLSVEKTLLQFLAEDCQISDVLSQLGHVIQNEFSRPNTERLLSLDGVLLLLVFLFSLAGDQFEITEEDTRETQDVLISTIIKEKEELSPIVKKIMGEAVTQSVVTALVEDLFDKLMALSESRNHLKQFSSILRPSDGLSPASHDPILQQIIEKIYSRQKSELTDIEYRSGGLKDLLKTGFSLFMNVSKPHPSDHPLLILFVVGGITSTEVKQVKDTLTRLSPDTQVVMGSTRMMNAEDVLTSIFCQNNTVPVENS